MNQALPPLPEMDFTHDSKQGTDFVPCPEDYQARHMNQPHVDPPQTQNAGQQHFPLGSYPLPSGHIIVTLLYSNYLPQAGATDCTRPLAGIPLFTTGGDVGNPFQLAAGLRGLHIGVHHSG